MEEEFGPIPTGLSEAAANAQFDLLQAKLVPLWQSIRSMNQDEQTIVVVPSMNVDAKVSGVRQQALEERFLFLLLLLRQLGPDIQWVESYVAGDKTFCVYLAKDEEIINEHARRSGFPASIITEVKRMIDPTTANA